MMNKDFLNNVGMFGGWFIEPSLLGPFIKDFSMLSEQGIQDDSLPGIANAYNGVGVLEVVGVLSRYTNNPFSNYDLLTDELKALNEAPNVHTIVINADTPGGSSIGTREFADQVLNSPKKVVVFSSGVLASAGYYFASSANRIVLTPSAMTGSIGTMMKFLDLSKMLEKEGVKMEVISSGKFKGMGSPGTALTDEQREHLQQQVDFDADGFKAYVQANRGPIEPDLMEGQVFSGEQALEAGLVDELTPDFETLLSSLS